MHQKQKREQQQLRDLEALGADGAQAYEVLSAYVVIVAIANFTANPGADNTPVVAKEIFLAVVLARLAALVRRIDGG